MISSEISSANELLEKKKVSGKNITPNKDVLSKFLLAFSFLCICAN